MDTHQKKLKNSYTKIGEPLAPLDKPGEINYLSSDNPNKINFYAGRRNKGFVYSAEDPGRTQEGYQQLVPYSPGRYQAAFVSAPGTETYNKLSGAIDLAYSAVPELLLDKGVGQVMNQFKNLRRVNKLLDQETGEVLATGKRFKLNQQGLRKEAEEQIAKDIDGLTGEGLKEYMLGANAKLKAIDTGAARVTKATNRQVKQYGFW